MTDTTSTGGPPTDPDCVFCAIAEGRAEASIVHEDETAVAFMDLRPVTPGHLLVIPRAHAPALDDPDDRSADAVWTIGRRLARALRDSTLRCEGINFFVADGEAAFQEVFHFHLHVFPRFAGDPFRLSADWHTRERPELDATAAAVRAALAAGPGHA
ncbi:HIT domain-containing protein [Streptomyces sp. RFCAC02]|uniref:HIT family protein n=1 Tax=Streptomyces sp. RFCAC02 TaxID=2499143 RepID=UPI001021CD37|nr:HIT domain-containing protein [Streptomyces sp. RFCAC02]